MKKKMKIILFCTILVIFMFDFWNEHNLDIKLFIDEHKFDDEYSTENMVSVKAHDFIYRISNYYKTNTGTKNLDNYFDENCDIYLRNSTHRYKNIRGRLIENIKYRRSKSNKNYSMLMIVPTKSIAKIKNIDDDKINVIVNGNFKLLSVREYYFNAYKEIEEISYEYTVTFEKQFLFVWKATEFKSDNSIIENMLIGNF